jgi:hypothetical protein
MNAPASITVRVPLKIRRRPGRKTVVQPLPPAGADTALPTRADPALVKALARAFRYQKLLDQGRYSSITEMAAGEKIDRGSLGGCCGSPYSPRISSRRCSMAAMATTPASPESWGRCGASGANSASNSVPPGCPASAAYSTTISSL